MKIKCPRCGYTTSFIEDQGIIRRDYKVHGNQAESITCFNCNTLLELVKSTSIPNQSEPTTKVNLIDHSNLDKSKTYPVPGKTKTRKTKISKEI